MTSEAKRAYNKAYREANRERLAAYDRERYGKTGRTYEDRKDYLRSWYQRNKQRCAEVASVRYDRLKADPIRYAAWLKRSADTAKRRPDLRLQRDKRWRQANPELSRAYKRTNTHRRRGAEGSHTTEQWLARAAFYGWCCAYCQCTLTIATAEREHVIAITNGGKNWASNLVPACHACNQKKGTKYVLPTRLVKES